MNPVALVLMVGLVMAILVTKRTYAIIVILCAIVFFSLQQKLQIGGFDLPVVRIVVFAGLFRIITKQELQEVTITDLDKAVIMWTVVSFVTYSLLHRTPNAFFLKFARTLDHTGTYFIGRALIRNMDDLKDSLKYQTLIMSTFAATMLVENFTYKNPLSFIGEIGTSYVRDGKYRCRGTFLNSLNAGSFGATSLPLVFGAWAGKKIKTYQLIIGLMASAIITYAAASSGAAIAFIFCIIGMLIWFCRSKLKTIQKSIFVFLIIMHIFMNAPIWYLFAKVSGYIGGTGWHRSYLIDQAFAYIGDWWLIGTTYTAHWFPYTLKGNPNHADITNQFIMIGVEGGLLTMVLYILIIFKAYKAVGQALEKNIDNNGLIYWALGAALLGHTASFFSIYYYDQIANFFYLFLAMIAITTEKVISNPAINRMHLK